MTQSAQVTRRSPSAALLAHLQARLGDRLSVAQAVRDHHGTDESPYPPMPPDAVAQVRDAQELAWVVAQCHAEQVPVIARGAGSSLEGHTLAVQGGITLDLSQMNQILEINPADMTATVQAGVTRHQLNDHLHDTGLFFPIDPGADATLGGMCATRASGTNAVRYGTMRDNVRALKVVRADGQLIHTGTHARKSSAGYDLTGLFVGSEGTLGLITEVTVRLSPRPEAISAAVCHFPDLASAVRCVIDVMQSGVPIARVEFMDVNAVRATNAYSKLGLAESPLLLFEFHGTPTGIAEQAEVVRSLTDAHGGTDFDWANHPEDRNRLWTARHQAYFAGLQLRPGCRASSTDVCVPISQLADCVMQTAADLDHAPFPYTILGHVGDGNFHVLMLLDPDSQAEWQASETINQRMVERALAMRGTCTGEHGIGLHKMRFMQAEHGEAALTTMRTLKQALDPHNILNPGKMLPDPQA